jgi:hypothetical protein
VDPGAGASRKLYGRGQGGGSGWGIDDPAVFVVLAGRAIRAKSKAHSALRLIFVWDKRFALCPLRFALIALCHFYILCWLRINLLNMLLINVNLVQFDKND